MMKVNVDYPSFAAEKNIINLKKNPGRVEAVLSTDDLLGAQDIVDAIYVDEKIKDLFSY